MFDTRRREFITLLGGAAVTWPPATRGPQGERVRRIGVLMNRAADNPEGQDRLAAFHQGLQELGWNVGPDGVATYQPHFADRVCDRRRSGHVDETRMNQTGLAVCWPLGHDCGRDAPGGTDDVSRTQQGYRPPGQWGPLPPTGKRCVSRKSITLRFVDGKVVEQRGLPDNLAALRQLGVVPTPQATSS
jgi:hypothetical protein